MGSEGTRDETTVEVVYLLAALVTPVLLMIVFEAAAWRIFGLSSEGWHVVGRLFLVVAALVGAAGAVLLNLKFRQDHRRTR